MKTVVYLLLLAGIGIYAVRRPEYPFDRFGYASVLAGLHTDDTHEAARIAKAAAHLEAPYSPYLTDLMNDDYHLQELRLGYSVKPLYIAAINATWRLVGSLNIALNVVSAFGAVALGVVLLLWTRKPLWCALLVATPQFINLARNAVPDSISTVLVIAALWAVIKEKPLAAVSLLAIATWVRPDTFIVAGICFLWMARKGMISWLYAVLLSSLILGSVSFISHEAGGFTWRMIMVNSFLKRLPAPLEHVPSLSVSEYVRILFGAFRGFAAETAIVIYSFIGIVAWRLNSRLKPLLGICLLTFIIRFFIFPVTDDRFFVWMYLCCGIALIDAIEPSRAMITAHCCPVKS